MSEEDRDRFLRLQEKMIENQERQLLREQRTTRGPIFKIRSHQIGKMLGHGHALLEQKKQELLAQGYPEAEVDALARTFSLLASSASGLHEAHTFELSIDDLRAISRIENLAILNQLLGPPPILTQMPPWQTSAGVNLPGGGMFAIRRCCPTHEAEDRETLARLFGDKAPKEEPESPPKEEPATVTPLKINTAAGQLEPAEGEPGDLVNPKEMRRSKKEQGVSKNRAKRV